MAWTKHLNPFGKNRSPVMMGWASDDSGAIPIAVNPNTGEMLTSSSGGIGASLNTGQVTVSTSQVQLSGSSVPLSNGVMIKAPSSNGANIMVGLTGVTATTGDILEPGDSRGYVVSNLNLIYIISASSSTDKVSFSAN